ncbi:hypothetical protein NPX13_g7919 [Xylaria arbuscula]|uniref:Uncharacterized protein n=1 Tax=Xylaria arbuscula TaxID=114810 RepID=A0A9W8N9R2_9PEZI|nr:hypothetical protein NPX13_g7919 [Xylaria arbuscula]
MQPANIPDEDPSASELGYDIIGTDGESQAESVASSFDYQKSDDIHSLTGTDVDTDSSDDEETNMHETTISDATVVDYPRHDEADEAAEAEALDMVNKSLESPTSLSLTNFGPFTASSPPGCILPTEPTAPIRSQSSVHSKALCEPEEALAASSKKGEADFARYLRESRVAELIFDLFCESRNFISQKRRLLITLSSLIVFYGLAMATKSLLLSSMPRELLTVPVASVSVAVPFSSHKPTPSFSTSIPTLSQTYECLHAASSSKSAAPTPSGKDNTQADVATVPELAPICSAELSGRDEIVVRIPPAIKSNWLAKEAILIAVSRGLEDIPTKVSSIDVGFAIRVPLKQAHGVLLVTIATTRKPFVNESFRINFGNHRFTEALDAGKQLVRDFAQRVVGTVNGTTSWVEETYIPAFDVVSQQVYNQTTSVSGSVLHGLQDITDLLMSIPRHVIAQMQSTLDAQSLRRRASQLQLELAQEVQDVYGELRMAVLTSQINSKLMWLALQGKTEEHGKYLHKAELYCKEQRARVESARVERAERTKKQIRAWRERDGPIPQQTTAFWHTMGAWAGLEGW